MPTSKVLSSHRAEEEDTLPDPTLASRLGSFILSPGLGVPAQPPWARLLPTGSAGRKIVPARPGPAPTGKVSSADRQPRGGEASQQSPRPRRPIGRGPLRGLLRGASGSVQPARPPWPRWPKGAPPGPRRPVSASLPRTQSQARAARFPGFRPPGQFPLSPASSTADRQRSRRPSPEAPSGKRRPASSSSRQPRQRPTASPARRWVSACLPASQSQAAAARARSPATRPGPPSHRQDRLCTPEVTYPPASPCPGLTPGG